MQLGIRLHDSIELPLEERLDAVKKQGFSCVHIALTKTKGLPSGTDELTPGYAAYLKHIFEQKGLDLALLGNYQNLANPDPGRLAAIQKRYTAHLRFAALLGCPVVGTETGAPNLDYHEDLEASHSEEALDTFIRNLTPVVKDAERFGVILAIEPVYKHIVWNPQRARRVLDAISSPNLQIIFDPVNLLHPDNIDRREEVLEEAIDLLGRDICLIHLKDYRIRQNEDGSVSMPCMACGTGEMNYDKVIDFAVHQKPYIQATLENTTPANARAARKFIDQLQKSRCAESQH